MAIVIHNDGDVIVGTISERNLLTKRFDGMQVTVKDATGDEKLGGGSAKYEWDASGPRWALVWSDHKDTVGFATERKVLTGGVVIADNIPANGQVWSCRIVDSNNVIIRDVTPTVNLQTIEIYTSEYDGSFLEYTYAYGSIGTQFDLVLDNVENSLNQKLSKSGGIMTGSIVPGNAEVDLGTLENPFRHLYVSENSIYINGEKFVSTDEAGDLVISAGPNQNLIFESKGTGTLDVMGNAVTADRLKTPVTINGVPFDGAGNIVVGLGDGTGVVSTSEFNAYKADVVNGDSTVDYATKALSVASHILPLGAGIDIGSTTNRFRSIYVDEAYLSTNTLYIGDTAILGTSADTIIIKADPDQSMAIQTSGIGTTSITSEKGISAQVSGLNSDVVFNATGAGGKVRFGATQSIDLTAPEVITYGSSTVAQNQNVGGNLTVTGNLTVNGTSVTVNAENVRTKDNIIVLNDGEIGTGVTAGISGIQVHRGELAHYQMVFDETDDMFKVGQIGNLETIASQNWVSTNVSTVVNTTVGTLLDFNTAFNSTMA